MSRVESDRTIPIPRGREAARRGRDVGGVAEDGSGQRDGQTTLERVLCRALPITSVLSSRRASELVVVPFRAHGEGRRGVPGKGRFGVVSLHSALLLILPVRRAFELVTGVLRA